LEDLQTDLKLNNSVVNHIYNLHFYKGNKGRRNILYSILFVDEQLPGSDAVSLYQFKMLDVK